MPRPSTIAARCVALSTSIAQARTNDADRWRACANFSSKVTQDVGSFARKVRDARHDLHGINSDLLAIRTGLGVAQEDFSSSGSKFPPALVDAVSQVLDSCDDTCERLHKTFLKLSCSQAPKDDWQTLQKGYLVNLRHDLNGSLIVLELSLDYITLFGQQDTLDSFLKCYVSDLITTSDDLLKRTDKEEIHINLTARERLPSLLQAIRLLRSCITAISREGVPTPVRRTTTPRPDSLEPSLGESRRSGRASPPQPHSAVSAGSKGIGTWLAGVPFYEDAKQLTHSAIKKVVADRPLSRSMSRSKMTPSRGTFYTDDGVSTSRTLVPPESRLRKVRSWCTDMSGESKSSKGTKQKPKPPAKDAPTVASSDVSIIHKKITSDKIAVSKGKRKDMNVDQRVAVDRILSNLPTEATASEVERILWEGANPMVAHPDFSFFFIRVAYEMSPHILKVLMDFGADITRTLPATSKYYSAMHAATLGSQLPTVRYLVTLGHSIDSANTAGKTPLHLAVKTPGAYGVAKYLVEMGADVNHEAINGDTPLMDTLTATALDSKERSMMIELLRAHGAAGEVNRDIDGRRGNSKGRTVLGIT